MRINTCHLEKNAHIMLILCSEWFVKPKLTQKKLFIILVRMERVKKECCACIAVENGIL